MISLNGYHERRWYQLLARGHRDDLASYHLETTTLPDGTTLHAFNVESATADRFHHVGIQYHPGNRLTGICTCKAHQFGNLCSHVALALETLGLLDGEEVAA